MITEIKKLKKLRKKLKLTQQQLATELGISIATLNRWESGKYKPSNLGLSKIRIFLKSRYKNKKRNNFK